jgi:hypothetical protein
VPGDHATEVLEASRYHTETRTGNRGGSYPRRIKTPMGRPQRHDNLKRAQQTPGCGEPAPDLERIQAPGGTQGRSRLRRQWFVAEERAVRTLKRDLYRFPTFLDFPRDDQEDPHHQRPRATLPEVRAAPDHWKLRDKGLRRTHHVRIIDEIEPTLEQCSSRRKVCKLADIANI